MGVLFGGRIVIIAFSLSIKLMNYRETQRG